MLLEIRQYVFNYIIIILFILIKKNVNFLSHLCKLEYISIS